MRNYIIILIFIALISCGKDRRSTPNAVSTKIVEPVENKIISKPLNSKEDYKEFIDTKFEYTDSTNKTVTIENSLPRGGLNFTDKFKKDHVYFIFWSKITNETDSSFELQLEFSSDLYELSSSSNNYFKIVFPTEKMEIDKVSLFDYGLSNLKSTLDNRLENSNTLKTTINSNETSAFYVIILFKKSIDGIVRTGLSLKDNKLYYKVNNKEIYSGTYNIKNLQLKN
jgi:hypothetical protein